MKISKKVKFLIPLIISAGAVATTTGVIVNNQINKQNELGRQFVQQNYENNINNARVTNIYDNAKLYLDYSNTAYDQFSNQAVNFQSWKRLIGKNNLLNVVTDSTNPKKINILKTQVTDKTPNEPVGFDLQVGSVDFSNTKVNNELISEVYYSGGCFSEKAGKFVICLSLKTSTGWYPVLSTLDDGNTTTNFNSLLNFTNVVGSKIASKETPITFVDSSKSEYRIVEFQHPDNLTGIDPTFLIYKNDPNIKTFDFLEIDRANNNPIQTCFTYRMDAKSLFFNDWTMNLLKSVNYNNYIKSIYGSSPEKNWNNNIISITPIFVDASTNAYALIYKSSVDITKWASFCDIIDFSRTSYQTGNMTEYENNKIEAQGQTIYKDGKGAWEIISQYDVYSATFDTIPNKADIIFSETSELNGWDAGFIYSFPILNNNGCDGIFNFSVQLKASNQTYDIYHNLGGDMSYCFQKSGSLDLDLGSYYVDKKNKRVILWITYLRYPTWTNYYTGDNPMLISLDFSAAGKNKYIFNRTLPAYSTTPARLDSAAFTDLINNDCASFSLFNKTFYRSFNSILPSVPSNKKCAMKPVIFPSSNGNISILLPTQDQTSNTGSSYLINTQTFLNQSITDVRDLKNSNLSSKTSAAVSEADIKGILSQILTDNIGILPSIYASPNDTPSGVAMVDFYNTMVQDFKTSITSFINSADFKILTRQNGTITFDIKANCSFDSKFVLNKNPSAIKNQYNQTFYLTGFADSPVIVNNTLKTSTLNYSNPLFSSTFVNEGKFTIDWDKQTVRDNAANELMTAMNKNLNNWFNGTIDNRVQVKEVLIDQPNASNNTAQVHITYQGYRDNKYNPNISDHIILELKPTPNGTEMPTNPKSTLLFENYLQDWINKNKHFPTHAQGNGTNNDQGDKTSELYTIVIDYLNQPGIINNIPKSWVPAGGFSIKNTNVGWYNNRMTEQDGWNTNSDSTITIAKDAIWFFDATGDSSISNAKNYHFLNQSVVSIPSTHIKANSIDLSSCPTIKNNNVDKIIADQTLQNDIKTWIQKNVSTILSNPSTNASNLTTIGQVTFEKDQNTKKLKATITVSNLADGKGQVIPGPKTGSFIIDGSSTASSETTANPNIIIPGVSNTWTNNYSIEQMNQFIDANANQILNPLPPNAKVTIDANSYDNTSLRNEGKIKFTVNVSPYLDASGNTINSPAKPIPIIVSGFKTATTNLKITALNYSDPLFMEIFKLSPYISDYANTNDINTVQTTFTNFINNQQTPNNKEAIFINAASFTKVRNVVVNLNQTANTNIGTIEFEYCGYVNGISNETSASWLQGTINLTFKSYPNFNSNSILDNPLAGFESFLQNFISNKNNGLFPSESQLRQVICDYLNEKNTQYNLPVKMRKTPFVSSDIICDYNAINQKNNPIIIDNITVKVNSSTTLAIPKVSVHLGNQSLNYNSKSNDWIIWLVVGITSALIIVGVVLLCVWCYIAKQKQNQYQHLVQDFD